MAHTNSSCYILITESSGMQRNSPFRGLVYREIFFQKSFLAKIRSYIYWIPSGVLYLATKYSLQGTTQGNGLTGGVPPVRFSM